MWDRSSRGRMQKYFCLTLPHNKLILAYTLLSRLQSLNFHLKVFHPQNCVYSIIADIKRYTLENRTANESNGQSEQNGRFTIPDLLLLIFYMLFGLHICFQRGAYTWQIFWFSSNDHTIFFPEASLKAKLSAVANEWLTTSELNLCTLQVCAVTCHINDTVTFPHFVLCVLNQTTSSFSSRQAWWRKWIRFSLPYVFWS